MTHVSLTFLLIHLVKGPKSLAGSLNHVMQCTPCSLKCAPNDQILTKELRALLKPIFMSPTKFTYIQPP